MRRLFLLLLAAGVPAWAADAAAGASLFNNACASCHQARAAQSREGVKAGKRPPDLVRLSVEHPERLNAWVLDPQVRQKRDTACDTTRVTGDELPSLYAYFQAQASPPTPRGKRRLEELGTTREARQKALGKKKGDRP